MHGVPSPVLRCKVRGGRGQRPGQEAMWCLPTGQAEAEARWLGVGGRAKVHLL